MMARVLGKPPFSGRRTGGRVDQQFWTIEALGRLAPGSAMERESVTVLIEVFQPEECDVSTAALAALGEFGPAAAPAVPMLLQMLRQGIEDQKSWLAVWIAATLARIAPGKAASREACRFLVGFLKAAPANSLLRFKAAEAVGEFGPDAAEAIPSLIDLLTRGALPGRVPAAKALGRIAAGTARDDEVVKALVESLRMSPDYPGTPEVIEVLAQFGQKAAIAIPRLEELKLSPNMEVRNAAQKALATLKVTP